MLGLAKHTHAAVEGVETARLLKVLTAAEAATSSLPEPSILLWDEAANVGACGAVVLQAPRDPKVIQPGDVVRLRPDSGQVSVLWRRASHANVLFTTEQCNSLCLMCSQPPRVVDDAWRVGELLRLVALIDTDTPQLGVTGGEPTLLGEGLAEVLAACGTHLPDTHLHVLTNGRRFGEPRLARALIEAGGRRTTWAVPLAGDTPWQHDEIMGAPGGFAETMLGLSELAAHGARLEIRIVLHALSAPRLPQLADFIYRRLPFAEHVAFMGLEPMGLAKGNRDRLWIDPGDYAPALETAVRHLAARGLSASIYNLPLCVLPPGLHSFARQSISDWKNTFPPECAPCPAKDRCSGFFASAGPAWRSRLVHPLTKDPVHDLA